MAIRGAAAILFGLLAMFWPASAAIAVVFVVAAFLFIEGAFAIGAAVHQRNKGNRWGWLLFEGTLGVLAGTFGFVAPMLSAMVLTLVIAAWALIRGVVQVATGLERRTLMDNPEWHILQGVLAILLALALAIWTLPGTLALAWAIGVYAVVFGAGTLGFAMKMRKRATATDDDMRHRIPPTTGRTV